MIEVPANLLRYGINSITITAQGIGRCYYSVETRAALPVTVPAQPSLFERLLARLTRSSTAAYDNAPDYSVKRVYVRTTSRRNFLMEDTVPKPDTDFNPNENMVVRLIIDCRKPGSQIVIDEPVPAGCRITEQSSDAFSDWSNWWDYTDVRDDRVYFFISNLARGEHEIDYHLQAQTPGRYDVMPTTITSTADSSVYAQGMAARIQIDE